MVKNRYAFWAAATSLAIMLFLVPAGAIEIAYDSTPNVHPDSNTLYYLFSTVAQGLASGLGVIAACALYRLQRLSDVLRERKDDLLHSLDYQAPGPGDYHTFGDHKDASLVYPAGKLKQAILSHNADNIWAATEEYCKARGISSPYTSLPRSIEEAHWYIVFISKALLTSLASTMPIVGLAMILLVFVPAIGNHQSILIYTCSLVIEGLIVSLIMLTLLVWLIVESRWTTI